MDLKDIKAIIDLMKKNSISEFELEKGQEFKIKLKRGLNGGPAPVYDETLQSYSSTPTLQPGGGNPAQSMAASAASPASSGMEIKSPMIGTFYRAPSPESGNYVEVGSEVGPDTVVCIIEAMKVMNEIKAETKGVITATLLDNAKPVEFGQPLFKIRPL
ncbi:MAG: acetyl-CoA carboxylase biotin carboxyl carrier protein [Opitutaceae bacterium]|nr:acetyl-CoA carboxylase biotin carboxyl carrier protein [Verrucomicrobiales bacterium]